MEAAHCGKSVALYRYISSRSTLFASPSTLIDVRDPLARTLVDQDHQAAANIAHTLHTPKTMTQPRNVLGEHIFKLMSCAPDGANNFVQF